MATGASVKFLNLNQDHPSKTYFSGQDRATQTFENAFFVLFFLSHTLSIRFDYRNILKKQMKRNAKLGGFFRNDTDRQKKSQIDKFWKMP